MGVTFNDIDDDEDSETHEINVTPFIDVMLVLLIIFMVAAPLSTVDLPIDLPTSSAVPQQKKPDKPTYVSIQADLAVAIGETPVSRADLVRTLDEADPNKDRRIFLRADRLVPYGDMMDVLELLRQGGYTKVALVALEGRPAGTSQPPPASANQPAPAAAPQ